MKNPSTNRVYEAAVYRASARAVDETEDESALAFSCNAIFYTATSGTGNWAFRDENPFVKRFNTVFKPEGTLNGDAYFGDPMTRGNKGARVLALCFMAAMVEAGDA